MRIAFTSCLSAQLFPNQPVWEEIGAHNPDVLVLLGDSIYLDVGGPYNTAAIQELDASVFGPHAHARFSELLNQPNFKALVQRPALSTYAIWDDHDFLWNDACGADEMHHPRRRELAYQSRAMFAAFRKALALRLAAGSFPSTPPIGTSATPAPGHSVVALGQKVFLHLTDGRSFKERRGSAALLGMSQLDAIEASMAAAPPQSTHLIASGVVFEARHGETWLDCAAEHGRMLELANQYNILILSGDIHDNNLATYRMNTGRNLFEATSSGAALRTAVVFGSKQRNYGLLTIDDASVKIDLFKSSVRQYQGTLDRATWQ